MNVALLDLKLQYKQYKDEILPILNEIYESQYFILGPKVAECEAAIAAYSTCEHAIGVASGTDALLIALMAENIGEGDEVITSPYTFFATAGCISRTEATPVFVDIDPDTYNIDPAQIEAKITPRTKAIIPVHLYGQMADMDPIMEIARNHKLIVIEDSAQSIGSEYNGKRSGSIGDYGCYSFFPSKNLGAFGDAGMVVTNDEAKAEQLKIFRMHGMEPKYYHKFIGGNFRIDAVQAAVVTVKLKYLDDWSDGRKENALFYNEAFADLAAKGKLFPPTALENRRHIYNQYIVRSPDRDALKSYLLDKGIGCEIYYPVPLHVQDCFKELGYVEGDMPESEKAARETLALPIFPELGNEQRDYVAATVNEFFS
ncbi:MAG: DegT/DnrJ/EryC1/StrS family aminotransferase [Lentisphaeria bacterium]|nr:DegT/DnrJ/EryC1/StrS family aminotransferase [Lentisphaeria bacterium]NQZ66878.1 DegT/DnrJ/EryC1/StrS family aminotransferase [Lentisphaeria bacterium]